jgi:putative ABC transport system substrate-binding protein
MERRAFLQCLTGSVLIASVLVAPRATEAQQKTKTWRVGFLSGGGRPPDGAAPLPLRQALQALGYVESRNVVYVSRWAEAKQDRLPGLAAELVGLDVDVIVTVGGPASAAASQASPSIPVVMALVGDADGLGLIDSLARPGGHVTGVTDQSTDLSAKRLEIIAEAVPRAARIAVLWNADDRGMTMRYREVEKAAHRLHIAVQALGVREPDDFAAAFSAMIANPPDALVMVTDALTVLNRKRVIEFSNQDDNFRLAGAYVDRIFKGSSPSSLPVQRPERYYLTINLKTAKALGLTLPRELLLRADQLIE